MKSSGFTEQPVGSGAEKRRGYGEMGPVSWDGKKAKVWAGATRLEAEVDDRTGKKRLVFDNSFVRNGQLDSKKVFEMFKAIIEAAGDAIEEIVIPSDNEHILAVNELKVIVGEDQIDRAKKAFVRGEGKRETDPKKESFIIKIEDYRERLEQLRELQ
jgi:hypothetical protein